VRIIDGDLDDPAVSRAAAPAVDVVMHLGANIDTTVPEAELRVNDIGTENLLRWLGGASKGARVLYTSSVAVLDRSGPATGPLTESSPATPRTPYGLTKLRGEHIIEARAAADGFTYTILRLPTVYGSGAKPGGMFDLLFALTARGSLASRLNWPGRTSIIHVNDAASLFIALSQRAETANQTYCIANPVGPTVGDLARDIGRVSGHPVRPIDLPPWLWSLIRRVIWNRLVIALVPPPARVAFWRLSLIADDGFWFDTSKLQSVWREPFVDLDAGLREMLASRGASGRVLDTGPR
jgi:nucleoside-diphosphate-sugar epimerase